VVVLDVTSENKGSNGGELDQNVDSWSGGILKWISNGVTDNGSNVEFLVESFLCFGISGFSNHITLSI